MIFCCIKDLVEEWKSEDHLTTQSVPLQKPVPKIRLGKTSSLPMTASTRKVSTGLDQAFKIL